MEKGNIKITRTKQFANKLRSISIFINKKEVDSLAEGETKNFELDAGINEIYVKIDWCKTKPLKIDIRKNETQEFILGSNAAGWKILFSIYYIAYKTENYLYLKKK